MVRNRYTDAQKQWIMEMLPNISEINYALDKFEEEFGERPSKNAVYQWAWVRGIHIGSNVKKEPQRAERRIYWKKEPELFAWMMEHDKQQPIPHLCDEFEEEFGFRISRSQVSIFRSQYGTTSRRSHGGGKERKPLGFKRATKGGTLVKVREQATVGGTKDNWEYEHHIVYKEAFGEIPEGHQIVFIDHDRTNCVPSNLYAIPKTKMALVNQIGWKDRETLEFALALAGMKTAIKDAQMRPQTCKVCGKTFKPWNRASDKAQMTCKECLNKGSKHITRTPKGNGVCAVCGDVFTKHKSTDKRCTACVKAKPSWATDKHAVHYRRTGER